MEPIILSTNGFCHGEHGAVRTCSSCRSVGKDGLLSEELARVLAQGRDAGERPIWFLDTAGYTPSISSTTGSTFATFATCSNLSFCTDVMNLPFASAMVVK